MISGDEADFNIYTEDGKLIFDITGTFVYTYLTYDEYFYEDVRVVARARNRGSNNNNVSLICRESELGWYEFNIANNGLYSIDRYDDPEGYVLLFNGGSTSIRTGKDVNEYTAVCEGTRLTLLINGVEERSVKDTVLQEGRVGVSVSSFENVPVLVEFEWVEISIP